MNQKYEITKVILETMNLPADKDRINKTIPTWWVNIREKDSGGLRLTEQGLEVFQKAEIKCYEVKFDEALFITNKLIIWLDRNIDCPFFITNRKIYLFGERAAVQLVLFSGNLKKYQRAHERFLEKQEIS